MLSGVTTLFTRRRRFLYRSRHGLSDSSVAHRLSKVSGLPRIALCVAGRPSTEKLSVSVVVSSWSRNDRQARSVRSWYQPLVGIEIVETPLLRTKARRISSRRWRRNGSPPETRRFRNGG